MQLVLALVPVTEVIDEEFSKIFYRSTEVSSSNSRFTRLGLQSDGHGGWYDKKGEFVAKTEGGKLVFYNQGDQPGRDPNQDRTQTNQRPVATQTRKVSQPQQTQEPEKKSDGETEGEDLGALTVAFGRFNPPTVGHQKLLVRLQHLQVEKNIESIRLDLQILRKIH